MRSHVDIKKLSQDIECYQELNLALQYNKDDLVKFINQLNLKEKDRMKYLVYLLKQHACLSLKEIGSITNKKPKTVSASAITTKKEILKNLKLKKMLTLKF